jgi:hypothetical protein
MVVIFFLTIAVNIILVFGASKSSVLASSMLSSIDDPEGSIRQNE